jgi:hypothetical protein
MSFDAKLRVEIYQNLILAPALRHLYSSDLVQTVEKCDFDCHFYIRSCIDNFDGNDIKKVSIDMQL